MAPSKDDRKDDPGPSVKDKELYESLRDEGNSKEKSARIANAAAAQGRWLMRSPEGERSYRAST